MVSAAHEISGDYMTDPMESLEHEGHRIRFAEADLKDLDARGTQELDAAREAMGEYQRQLDVIEATFTSAVDAIASYAHTPVGRREYMRALRARLEDTKRVIDAAGTDFAARAVASKALAETYSAVG